MRSILSVAIVLVMCSAVSGQIGSGKMLADKQRAERANAPLPQPVTFTMNSSAPDARYTNGTYVIVPQYVSRFAGGRIYSPFLQRYWRWTMTIKPSPISPQLGSGFVMPSRMFGG